MKILERIRGIIEANINDLLDNVENSEAKVNQVVRDLEDGLIEFRKHTAQAMANQRMSERNLEELQREESEWRDNARLALQKGEEALARKAVERCFYYESRTKFAREQLEEDRALVARLRSDLEKLESKVQEARSKKETILVKRRAAQAREQVLNGEERLVASMGRAQGFIKGVDSLGEFEKGVDRKLAQSEARAQLLDEAESRDYEQQLSKLKQEDRIERELSALRAELNGAAREA